MTYTGHFIRCSTHISNQPITRQQLKAFTFFFLRNLFLFVFLQIKESRVGLGGGVTHSDLDVPELNQIALMPFIIYLSVFPNQIKAEINDV